MSWLSGAEVEPVMPLRQIVYASNKRDEPVVFYHDFTAKRGVPVIDSSAEWSHPWLCVLQKGSGLQLPVVDSIVVLGRVIELFACDDTRLVMPSTWVCAESSGKWPGVVLAQESPFKPHYAIVQRKVGRKLWPYVKEHGIID